MSELSAAETLTVDIERLSAVLHAIYQAEARRQDDTRHPDDYDALSENTKEYDRVLARHIVWREEALRKMLADLRDECDRHIRVGERFAQQLTDLRTFLTELAGEIERRNDWLGRSELVERLRKAAK